ncbi:hypothetical protein BDC45DRAFT_296755 [Circinella umbellata]|nr:hypothetical protein BDC45DRAFT_296755 [Circinella umbellata]
MNDDNIFMDVDGPEFLNEVNNEINDFRAHVSTNDTIEQNIQNFYNAQPMDNNIDCSP